MEVVFQFESGSRCAVCGLYHADQWVCDPSAPNPWEEEPLAIINSDLIDEVDDFGKKVGW